MRSNILVFIGLLVTTGLMVVTGCSTTEPPPTDIPMPTATRLSTNRPFVNALVFKLPGMDQVQVHNVE